METSTIPHEIPPSSTEIWPWKEGEEVAISKLQNRIRGVVPDSILSDFATLRRFLIARQYDEDAAAALLKKAAKWREDYKPDRIKKSDIVSELKQGKIFLHGVDRQQRPCLVMMPGRHQPHRDKDKLAVSVKALIYWIEKAIRSMRHGVYQYVIIIDRAGFGLKNIDWNLMKEFAALQDFYPERLAACYVIRANFLVRRLWEALKTFADGNTTAKFRILNDDYREVLLREFTPDQLLPAHGGISKYVYAHDDLSDSREFSPATLRHATPRAQDDPDSKSDAESDAGDIGRALVRDLESSVASWDEQLTENLKHILLSDPAADSEPPLPPLPPDASAEVPPPSTRTLAAVRSAPRETPAKTERRTLMSYSF